MKKLSILLMTLTALAVISSCTAQGGSPKASLKTSMDSLSYALGVDRTQGLLPYIQQQGIDSAYMGEFVKGLVEGFQIKAEDKKKSAYMMGLQIGQQVGGNQVYAAIETQIKGADSTLKLSRENFVAGFIAATLQKDLKIDETTSQTISTAKMQEFQNKQMEKEFSANKEAGIQFLAENKTKEGVVTLPSGLQYKVITEGKGAIPTASDKVKVHYRGTLIDGTEFDSSYGRGNPIEFGVTQVIKGWTEALQLMPVGSKWMLFIPQDLAYGSANQGGQIKPFSTLVFEVELIDIVK